MNFTEKQIRDSVQFANFAQAVKMKYWEEIGGKNTGVTAEEQELDRVLLIAWKYITDSRKVKVTLKKGTTTMSDENTATAPAEATEAPQGEETAK